MCQVFLMYVFMLNRQSTLTWPNSIRMSPSIQEWTKNNLWKTASKKFERVCLPKADYTPPQIF